MAIANKNQIFGYYMIAFIVSVALSYILGMTLRNTILNGLLFMQGQYTMVQLVESVLVYVVLYIFWDVILFFCAINIFSGILAKVVGIRVGRMIWITLISSLITYLGFHLIMYLILLTDPLQGKLFPSVMYMYRIIEAHQVTTINDITDILTDTGRLQSVLFDVLFGYYYQTTFITDPTVINYVIVYILSKSIVSVIPYQVAGWAFNPYQYEILILFVGYLFIFSTFYYRFFASATCTTEDDLRDKLTTSYQKEFGKETRGILTGEQVTSESTISSDQLRSRLLRNKS